MSHIEAEPHLPAYNMKVVVHETGLNPMTIRTWERRYGLPHPPRAKGGHRLYSQHDIDTLKWLSARQAEGLSVHNAVEIWRTLEGRGEDPLRGAQYNTNMPTPLPSAEKAAASTRLVGANVSTQPTIHSKHRGDRQEADSLLEQQSPLLISNELPAGQLEDLCQQWLVACRRFDRMAADDVLTQAFALFPAELVCTEVLAKALALVGESWYHGEGTIQQEHFTSELAIRRLEILVAATSRPTRPGRILVGCAPEDHHTFAALLLSFLLLRQGWDVIYLGANLPAAQLDATIAQLMPQLIILSAQRLYTAATLLDVARELQPQPITLGYGGLVFNLWPTLRQQIPGHYLGASLTEAAQRVQELMVTKYAISSGVEVENKQQFVEKNATVAHEYEQALRHFLDRRALIESHVWSTLLTSRKPTDLIGPLNHEMTQTISAILKLGNIDYFPNRETWIDHLVRNFNISSDLVQSYFYAYGQAATLCLAAPLAADSTTQKGVIATLIDWLTQLARRE